MEERVLLKRSSKGLWMQILTGLLVVLLLGAFSMWLISIILGWAENKGLYASILMWIAFLGSWAIGSLKLWLDWHIKRYEIADEALIVHAKAGSFGSTQTVYRYESIISLQMRQGFWGKQFGFGDVEIMIPKIDKPILLNDVEDPLNQLANIQRRMDEKGRNASSHAFVV